MLPWARGDGATAEQLVLLVQAAAASVVAVAARSPFGESERSTGSRLAYLRLLTALALTAVAVGALAVGATGGELPGVRDNCCAASRACAASACCRPSCSAAHSPGSGR
ncbi:hypothetical protein [Streptacidiphilus sp. PAMC 29251]